jgi:hypothetical protein
MLPGRAGLSLPMTTEAVCAGAAIGAVEGLAGQVPVEVAAADLARRAEQARVAGQRPAQGGLGFHAQLNGQVLAGSQFQPQEENPVEYQNRARRKLCPRVAGGVCTEVMDGGADRRLAFAEGRSGTGQ